MLRLFKELDLPVVGEGVEKSEERKAVIECGCDLIQGHLLAKPARPFPSYAW